MLKRKLCFIFILSFAVLCSSCEKEPFDLKLFDDNFPLTYKKMSPNSVIEIISAPAICFFGDLDAAKFGASIKKKREVLLTFQNLHTNKSPFKVIINPREKSLKQTAFYNTLENGMYGMFVCDTKKKGASCDLKTHATEDLNQLIKGALFPKSKQRKLYNQPLIYSGNVFLKLDEYLISAKAAFGPEPLAEAYLKLFNTYKGKLPGIKKAVSQVMKIQKVFSPAPLLGPGLGVLKNKQHPDNTKVYFQIPKLSQSRCNPNDLKGLYKSL